MATLQDVREKYPQYNDMSDQQLADALHDKFYSDIPKADFYNKIGFKPAQDFGFTTENNGGILGQISGKGENVLTGRSLTAGRILNGLQGASFNFADEILPYTSAALDEAQRAVTGKLPGGGNASFDDRVNYYRDQARALGERMMLERPVETIGTQIGGGLLSGAGLMGGATKAIGVVAPETAAALKAGAAGLGARMVQGGLAGAAGGALAGAGAGTDAETRLGGAGYGAAFGAPLGAAFPLATSGLGALGRTIQSAVAPGTVNAENRAAGILGEAVARSGYRPGQPDPVSTEAFIKRGINNAALLDTSDELTSLAGAVARSPGRGRQIVTDFLRSRQEGDPSLGQAGGGQWSDLLNDISAHVSPSVSFKQAASAMIRARSDAAKPLYEEALKVGTVGNDELTSLANIPAMRSALQRGVNMAKQEGTIPSDYKLDTSKPLPVSVWHQAKQGIDDLIGKATRAGEKGQARSLITMQNRLLDQLDTVTDGKYGVARNQFAGDSAVLNSLENGKNILQRDISAEDIADQISKLTSQSEVNSFKAGAAQALRDTVSRVGRKGNAAGKFLNRPDIQQKLHALFNNEAEYKSFIGTLEGRDRMYRSYSELGGSPTQGRIAAEEDLKQGIMGGAAHENLLAVAAHSGKEGVVQALIQRLRDGSTRYLSDTVRAKLAEMLVSTDPKQSARAAQLIQQAAANSMKAQQQGAVARGAALQGLAIQPQLSEQR